VTAPLLSPELARQLDALRKLLRGRARSGGSGTSPGRRRGRGPEFEEHRPYSAGDDVGRLDWLAFARTGHPVSKEYRAEEETALRLLVDASASLDFGEPSKFVVALRLAAAMAYLSLSEGHRTELVAASAGGTRASPAHRGKAALALVLRELGEVATGGRVNLAAAIAHVVASAERPGVLLILSDFFDEGPVFEAFARARHAGHDLILVQILSREELFPDLDGDFTLVDSETFETVDLSADPATKHAYHRRLERLFHDLGAFARRSGALYVRADTAEPLVEVVRRILGRRRE
jgi:uncharacterized protein (DUF58 family)